MNIAAQVVDAGTKVLWTGAAKKSSSPQARLRLARRGRRKRRARRVSCARPPGKSCGRSPASGCSRAARFVSRREGAEGSGPHRSSSSSRSRCLFAFVTGSSVFRDGATFPNGNTWLSRFRLLARRHRSLELSSVPAKRPLVNDPAVPALQKDVTGLRQEPAAKGRRDHERQCMSTPFTRLQACSRTVLQGGADHQGRSRLKSPSRYSTSSASTTYLRLLSTPLTFFRHQRAPFVGTRCGLEGFLTLLDCCRLVLTPFDLCGCPSQRSTLVRRTALNTSRHFSTDLDSSQRPSTCVDAFRGEAPSPASPL